MSDTFDTPDHVSEPSGDRAFSDDSDRRSVGRSGARERILFVDDSRLIRFAATRGLSAHFDVVVAEDGEAAWKILCGSNDIRAVITDLNMPRLDGVGLIRRIRSSAADTLRRMPILVVTSIEEAVGRRQALDAGANDLVPKPFTDRDLIDPIRGYLARGEHVPSPSESNADVPAGDAGHGNVERRRSGTLLRIEQALRLHDRHGLPVSFLHVRLLNHRAIADRWGNAWAESTMRHLERQLADRVRVEDTVGRSAPDTFSLILPATHERGARMLLERLQRALQRVPARFPTGAVDLQLRCQVQLAGDASTAEHLLNAGLARLGAPNVTHLSQRATA